jgi:dephospho-CoA kinase
MLSRFGVPVIDADQVARAVVEPGTDALAKLKAHFGEEIIKDGRLDRRRLREIIFADEAKKQWVEALLHPIIQAEMLRRADQQSHAYVVLEIPLLLEGGYRNLVNRVLVVDAPLSLQIDRVVRRDQVQRRFLLRRVCSRLTMSLRMPGIWRILSSKWNACTVITSLRP